MEVFKFDKSHDQRRDEFDEILFNKDPKSTNTPSEFKDIWSEYLMSGIEESEGWTALWKLPKNLCDQYVVYPNTVLFVMVDKVHFNQLAVDLTVLKQHESIAEGSKFYKKPLKDLYPTVVQENKSLAIEKMAERLDQFRTFYEYLWRPWDLLIESPNWKMNFNDKRLRTTSHIFIEKEPAKHAILNCAWSLMVKGHKLFGVMDNVGCLPFIKMNKYLETGELLYAANEEELTASQVKFQNQLVQLVKDLNELEISDKAPCVIGPSIVVVMKAPLNDEEYIKHIEQITELRTSENWVFSESLPGCAADSARSIIIVTDTIYYLYDMTCLTHGGILRGLYNEAVPTIADMDIENCLCDFYGKQTTLSNLIFSMDNCKEVITVHKGCNLNMLDVNMRHENPLGTCAIIVQNSATLVADACHFRGFGIAIMAFPQSRVELNGCTFNNNVIGVKAFAGSDIRLTETDSSVVQAADAELLTPLLDFNFMSHPYMDFDTPVDLLA